ncbi:RNA-splicing ligase RtcB [Pirellulimonas nuda]|uniref:3'-phosphate/5'-hydroxy nucleic acid ligase n=1 Tax=Pirellulimonas nuda TaxID=2528009 RepID=A0A518DFT6_9BACT|nr:RtcB family protein [Pirellulimonas nuda]QDU90343.1 RNA-splicing ligase RtcB [Pirellulimonas nuda]
MTDPTLAPMETWLTEPLPSAVAKSVRRVRAAEGVTRVALMPDVHLANDVCVGAVVAADGVVYPQAVGGDIGCGMAALAFDVEASAIDNPRAAGALLAGLRRAAPIIRRPQAAALPSSLNPSALSDPALARAASRDGAVQLGTLGRGNHFLEFQAETSGRLWVMVHSGSRAVGQAVARHHLAAAAPARGALVGLDASSAAGEAYLSDAAWACAYAQQNRLAMLRSVAALVDDLLGVEADWGSLVHSDHNHVRRETHDGRTLLVHRKGAQSARDGEPGLIPGSMGAPSFHTQGKGRPAALASCSHGAGRRMSRSDARRTVSRDALARQVGALWFDRRATGKLRDEAPSSYKDIRLVMRAQRDLVRSVRELRPLLSHKGV